MSTVLERRIAALKLPCGFCATGAHGHCPGAVRNGANAPRKIVVCPCKEPGCKAGIPRCLTCKREGGPEDIDQVNWVCTYTDACDARVNARLDADPVVQKIRISQERGKMTEQAEKATRKAAEPKVGTCLVTGKPTKGGKFLPGMDARYVSLRVAEVLEGTVTEEAARERTITETQSEALRDKFNKSLTLAQDRAAKNAAAAKEKEEAKAQKAVAKEVVEDAPVPA